MSSSSLADVSAPAPPTQGTATVLVCVPSSTSDVLYAVMDKLVSALPGQNFLVASTDLHPEGHAWGASVEIVQYPQPPQSDWLLKAADYAAAASLAREHNAQVTLLLGAEAGSLSDVALKALVSAAASGDADLALPRYTLGPHEGLVNAALLYPLSRALFGVEAHMPLPLDVAFSNRMAARLAVTARKPGSAGSDPLLWPAAEAATGSLVVKEVAAGQRTLPQPGGDLNALLAQIAGSLFADLEAKAAFWQRARTVTPPTPAEPSTAERSKSSTLDLEEIRSMAESFRNAYTNLQEIWSLVLPPQSLLALKKLSFTGAEAFSMPANLWARIVYDFVLAYRLRTINRGHLLGALTPLYLAWAASHLLRSDNDVELANQHVEETASAFIVERPYILARWRWPDRFNP